MPRRFDDATAVMRHALELAARGLGDVEPNPLVGAVLVDDQLNLIAEGFHQRFGEAHAEVNAIASAGNRAAGSTLFVNLEPCCHRGQTGPCTEAIQRAGIRKAVVAMRDPFPAVNGRGIEFLQAAGIPVELGLLDGEARRLNAAFQKRVATGRPWVHAKWAMTLDGKIATRTGDSHWISNETSRAVAHRLRGRMDAIVAGVETVLIDDPNLTARPAPPDRIHRVARRVILDSHARLPLTSQLVRTVGDAPLLVAALSSAPLENVRRLEQCGVDVITVLLATPKSHEAPDDATAWAAIEKRPASDGIDLGALLDELGRRNCTHVLVEGGGRVLGSFFDAGLVDEVHVFVAPKVIGGMRALSAVLGQGHATLARALGLTDVAIQSLDGDVYINGRQSTGSRDP